MNKENILECPHPNDCELWNECERKFKIKETTYYERKKANVEICTILYPIRFCVSSEFQQQKFIDTHKFIIKYLGKRKWLCKCPHPNDCELWNECDHTFESGPISYREREKHNSEQCTKLNQIYDRKKRNRKKLIEKIDCLIGFTENDYWLCKCPHPNDCKLWNECEHQYVIEYSTYNCRKIRQEITNNSEIEFCTILNPKGDCNQISEFEKDVCKLFDNLLIPYTCNRRDLIKNDKRYLEIDISPNNSNILIECNGCFWHSLENPKTEKDQHIIKFKKCLEKGYELISIWEDWNYDDVYHFLKRKFRGKDVSMYKTLWFPDLKENEWPLDLGWPKEIIPEINKIKEHHCFHGKFECFDSGIVII